MIILTGLMTIIVSLKMFVMKKFIMIMMMIVKIR